MAIVQIPYDPIHLIDATERPKMTALPAANFVSSEHEIKQRGVLCNASININYVNESITFNFNRKFY